MTACKLMIGTGPGNEVPSGIGGLAIGPGAWSWRAEGEGVGSQTMFEPEPDPEGGDFGGVVDGDICTEIAGPFPKGTRLRLWPRAHHLGPPHVGYDAFIPCLAITETLDIAGTTARICEAIEAVHAAHEPDPVAVDCLTTYLPEGGARLCLSLPALVADWGVFTIEVLDPGQLYFECDYDIDAVVDALDNCVEEPNGNQADFDGDGAGDACDECLDEGSPSAPPPPGAACNTCCPGDLNFDGVIGCVDIDLLDLAIVFGNNPCADLDGDGGVSGLDLALLLGAIGECASCLEGETFAVADLFGGPAGQGTHFHSSDDCRFGNPPDSAEVGNYTGEEVRGLSEFDLAGRGPTSSAALMFETAISGGLFGQPPSSFTVVVLAYAGNNVEDLFDFQAPSTATVGSFSTAGLVVGQTIIFDVTAAYNAAIAAGAPALGIRLQRAAATDGAWVFEGFVLTVAP